jgi:hypothetical protein
MGKVSGFFWVSSGEGKSKWCILVGLLSESSHFMPTHTGSSF